MECNRKDLLSALNVIKPAVAKKEIVEQQTHVIFTGDYIAAINGQIHISYPFLSDLKTSVKAEDLIKILSSSSSELATLALNKKGDKLRVKASDTKAELSCIISDEDKVEELVTSLRREELEGEKFAAPEDFGDALYLCSFSASKKLTDGIIVAVFIDGDNVFTTDIRRSSWYKMTSPMQDMFISAKDALDLCNFDIKTYSLSENWGHFKTEKGALFSTRLLKGEMLPFHQLFDMLYQHIVPESTIQFPKELKEAVDATTVFFEGGSEDAEKTIEVSIKPGEILCTAQESRGWIEKKVEFPDYKGNQVSLKINPILFSQILDKTTKMFLSVSDKKKAAIFESGDFKHTIVLPRE